jgi:hypothetical protein
MSIHIEWGSKDQTLLIWRVSGELTLDAYITASKQTRHLVQSALYPVTILIDVRKCQYTTHNLIPTLREQINNLQSFQGEIVVFTKTQFWPNLYHVAAQSSIGLRLPSIRFHITQDENDDLLAALS